MLRASAASIQLTSIYDAVHARNDDADAVPAELLPYAHMLVVDGVHVLLDCGWDARFGEAYLQQLLPYVRRADAVLLSTPDMRSCGALPFVLEHLRPGAFVAAAGATARFGLHALLHTFLYQYPNTHTFTLPSSASSSPSSSPVSFTLTVDKIYSAFRSVREPYGGVVTVQRDGVELSCRALFTGRMLGGYAWLVRYQIDELLYCMDWALRPSYVLRRLSLPTSANVVLLPGFAMHRGDGSSNKSNNNKNNSSSSSSCIVSGIDVSRIAIAGDAGGGGNSGNKRQHEEQLQALFRHVQNTLRAGSDVLVPVDIAARGVEVLSLLHHVAHERGGGGGYTLVLASMQAAEVLAKAVTATESLQDRVILSERSWLSGVVACRSAHEAAAVASPKLVVADGAALDYGVAAELLDVWLSRNEAMHDAERHHAAAAASSSRSGSDATTTLLLQQQHLVVLVEPFAPRTNAARLAAAAQRELQRRQDLYERANSSSSGSRNKNAATRRHDDDDDDDDDDVTVEFAYTQRERLSSEELEQYYLQLEREADATRRRLAEADGARIVADDHKEDDDVDDEDDDEAAAAAPDKAIATAALIATVDRDPQAREAASSAALATAAATATAATTAASDTKTRARADGSNGNNKRHAGNTPGLTLPPHMHLRSKFLHFPVLERTATLQGALLRGDDVAYGLPVSDEEQFVLRARAPARVHSDAGPDAAALRNDAQREANEPAKTHTRVCVCRRRSCRVLYSDLSGLPDATALRTLLRSRLGFAKKLVVLRSNNNNSHRNSNSSNDDAQALVQLCRAERPPLRCADQVLLPPSPLPSSSTSTTSLPTPLELATHVYSYVAQLEPALSHALPRMLRHVRVANSNNNNSSGGGWQVAWLDAQLHARYPDDGNNDEDEDGDGEDGSDTTQQRKRRRSDDASDTKASLLQQQQNALLSLAPVRGAAARQACAAARAARGLRSGAVFVGAVDLTRLRDAARRDDGLACDSHAKAAMLVFDDAAACVRRSSSDGTLTLAAMATPAMYEVRQCLYRQFDHVL